ncbi:MAG TPA: glycosyltransferase [Agriterribacter sp.]|nr:glycosyltransferase [Agriterribacter sp.]
MILVSVCCITYNHEKYIARAIEGFLMQKTSFPFEIIIHDDASTDNTANIIREYAERDGRIKPILRDTNIKSTGAAVFPLTFKMAGGKYIALCEGDDYWTHPLKLQKQVDFLESNTDFSICFHKIDFLGDGKKKANNYHGNKPRTYTTLDLAQANFINTVSVMYRADEQPFFFKPPDAPVYGDYVMFMLLSMKGKIKYLPRNMAVYREHPGGMWAGEDNIKRLAILRSTINYLIPLVSADIQQVLSRQGMEIDAQRADEHILRNETGKAWEILTYGLCDKLDRFELWLNMFHLEVKKQNDQFPRGLKKTFFYFLRMLSKRIKYALFRNDKN